MPPTAKDYCRRLADTTIDGTVLRNQGAPGVVKVVRSFLPNIDLATFGCETRSAFDDELKRQTKALMDVLPVGARHFGTARKSLNLYLGETYYHQFVCREYGLDRIAHFLELPLDSQVASFLIDQGRDRCAHLPPWPGVKHLTEEESRRYQDFAAAYADGLGDGWYRIHLDVLAWRRQKKEEGNT